MVLIRNAPQHIAFDDFKSGKFANTGMSVVLVDIRCRRAVKTVTVDLLTTYRKTIHEMFHNAVIITNQFHIITQAYRALNMGFVLVL